MNKKTILIGLMILVMMGLAFAVPFTPQGNVDLKNYYNITNLAYLGAYTALGNIALGGFHITGIGDANATNVNGNQSWEHQSYPAACSSGYAITALGDSTTCTDSWVGISGDTITENSTFDYQNSNITGANELSSTLVDTTNLEADNLESNLDGTGFNFSLHTLSAVDYGLVEDDIPTLSSTWDNSMDADRLTGVDYLNDRITIQGPNITSGTIAEARLPSSIHTISLNGTNVDTGTVDEDYIEDKFLKNYEADTLLGALTIDQDSNAESFYIDSEATTSGVFRVTAVNTDGNVMLFSNEGNHADDTNYVFVSIQDHASSVAGNMKLKNDGTGINLVLDQNNNATCVDIDSEAANFPAINIQDIPSDIAIAIASGDKICFDGATCSHHLYYNGSCIVSSSGNCV